MAKKFIAALLALTMCAGLAGCGNKSDKKDSSTSKASANTSAADTDAANDKNTADSKADDGGITVPTELNKDNIAISGISGDCNETPTNDELLTFAELTVKQYNAIQSNDKENIKRTLAFGKIIDPFCELAQNTDIDITGLYLGDVDDDDMSLKEKEMITWGMMLSMCSDLDEADTDKADEYDALGDDLNKRLNFVNDNLDFDEFSALFWNSGENFVPMGELNSDAIMIFELNGFERDGDDMFTNFDLVILNGNDMFRLFNVNAWYMDNTSGIMINHAERSDNNYADMTIDEIKQMIEEKGAEN